MPVTVAGRSASRFAAVWPGGDYWHIAGFFPAQWYLVDRDEQFPSWNLCIVGFHESEPKVRVEIVEVLLAPS